MPTSPETRAQSITPPRPCQGRSGVTRQRDGVGWHPPTGRSQPVAAPRVGKAAGSVGTLGRRVLVVALRLAAAVSGPGKVLPRSRAAVERWQGLGPLQIDPHPFGQSATVILIAVPEVPDHPQLDILRA